MIAVLVLGLLISADSPHAGMAMPGAPQEGIVVEVVAHSAAGRQVPGAGAEVRLEQRMRGAMEEDSGGTLERVWIAKAGADGRAIFTGIPELAPGRQITALVRWGGVDWPTELSERGPTQVAVFAVTADRSILRAQMGYGLNVSEDEIFIEQTIRITPGSDPRAVDVDRDGGIRIPLLTHAVFDDALDVGWVPPRPDPNMTLFQVQPALGRLVVERGAMVYRGLVPPDGITIQATYPAPYVERANHTLAMRSPIELESLQVTLRLGHGLDPEVALRVPYQALTQPTGDGEQRMLRPLVLPKAGEAFFVEVRDMPARMVLLRPLAIGLGLLVVLALTLAFLRTRRAA